MHLKPEELIDLAEGTHGESAPHRSSGARDALSGAEAHLAGCNACRRQLDDLRAMMAAAADVGDVPEPSPLFWEHLSDRVRGSVAAEPPLRGWNWWLRAAVPFVLAAAAAILIAFAATTRLLAPHAEPPSAAAFVAAPPAPAPLPTRETLGDITDPLLALVAGLTENMDWEDEHDAGLAPHGSADHAITHMSEGELRELRDLLQEEMANSGD